MGSTDLVSMLAEFAQNPLIIPPIKVESPIRKKMRWKFFSGFDIKIKLFN